MNAIRTSAQFLDDLQPVIDRIAGERIMKISYVASASPVTAKVYRAGAGEPNSKIAVDFGAMTIYLDDVSADELAQTLLSAVVRNEMAA